MEITKLVKQKALDIGFDLVGVSPVGDFPENQYYKEWISRGYHAGMDYMRKNPGRRVDVRSIVPGARSVVSCAVNYNTDAPYSTDIRNENLGWISRYAWSDDYHYRINLMIRELGDFLSEISESELNYRAYVDTGPVLERVYAKYAGIGWTGKNTCIINQEEGSWLFLAELITDIELDYDHPVADRCGSCTMCIDACPTDALRQPYVLDSNRCISYLTIENKGEIPPDKRNKIENNIFGCDICQDVCPWNRKAGKGSDEFLPREGFLAPDLGDLVSLDQEQFSGLFRRSPVKRAKRRGLLRNVLVAIGNSGNMKYIDDVRHCLHDDEPLVRSHAVWALWKLEGEDCLNTLSELQVTESDDAVLNEIKRIFNISDEREIKNGRI